MTEQRAVRRYTMTVQMGRGAFEYEVHAHPRNGERPLENPKEEFCLASDVDHLQRGFNATCEHILVVEAERDALSTELAEAKAEIERMREALSWIIDAYHARFRIDIGRLYGPIDREIEAGIAALIPAKGKGE